MSELAVHIPHLDSIIAGEIRQMAQSTAVVHDLQKQLQILAKAILQVEEHCLGLEKALAYTADGLVKQIAAKK